MSRSTFGAIWLGCVLAAQLVEAADARQDLERMAAALPVFVPRDFVGNLQPTYLAKDADASYRQIIGELTTTKYKVDDLIALLIHADPKVRTLAAAALFAREDPKLLPYLLPLAEDQADTFPTTKVSVGMVPGYVSPLRTQKVGDCVEPFLGIYVSAALTEGGAKAFPGYWETRKNRDFCTSWFAVRLSRAMVYLPVQEDRKESIRALRPQIDRLPKADRTWTLLALDSKRTEGVLVSDAELVAMCKELGPDSLMRMLLEKVPSDDPDLQWGVRNNFYASMTNFVLDHARDLLRPEDADTLLSYQRWHWDPSIDWHKIDPEWIAAAAELQPTKARELLHEAIRRYVYPSRREKLPLTLWRLFGPADILARQPD